MLTAHRRPPLREPQAWMQRPETGTRQRHKGKEPQSRHTELTIVPPPDQRSQRPHARGRRLPARAWPSPARKTRGRCRRAERPSSAQAATTTFPRTATMTMAQIQAGSYESKPPELRIHRFQIGKPPASCRLGRGRAGCGRRRGVSHRRHPYPCMGFRAGRFGGCEGE
jgi:hypothetical protein